MGVQSRLNDMRIFGLLPGHRPTTRAPALRWRDTVGPPLRRRAGGPATGPEPAGRLQRPGKARRRGPARLRPIGGPVGLQDVPDSGTDDPPFEAATTRPGASQGPSGAGLPAPSTRNRREVRGLPRTDAGRPTSRVDYADKPSSARAVQGTLFDDF